MSTRRGGLDEESQEEKYDLYILCICTHINIYIYRISIYIIYIYICTCMLSVFNILFNKEDGRAPKSSISNSKDQK